MTDDNARAGMYMTGLKNKAVGSIGAKDLKAFYLAVGNCGITGTAYTTEYVNDALLTVDALYARIFATEKYITGNEDAVYESYTVTTAAALFHHRHICLYSFIEKTLANGTFGIAVYACHMPLLQVFFHGSAVVRYIFGRYGREDLAVLHLYWFI